MHAKTQRFIKNFFEGVFLEGQPITEIVIRDNPKGEGTGVQLFSLSPHSYHLCLHFPEGWEIPTLVSKEDWQQYMEASRAVDIEEAETDERREYVDLSTGVLLIVERDNPGYPGHPKLTFVCPENTDLSVETINGAMSSLQVLAKIPPHQRIE